MMQITAVPVPTTTNSGWWSERVQGVTQDHPADADDQDRHDDRSHQLG